MKNKLFEYTFGAAFKKITDSLVLAFIEKAPKEVVDELKEKFKALSSDQTRIEEQLKLL